MLSDQNKATMLANLWSDGLDRELHTMSSEALNMLLDAARQEGRQSAGDRVKALEEALRPIAERIVDIGVDEDDGDRFSNALTPYSQSVSIKVGHVRRAAALLAPQAAPADQKEGASEEFPDALTVTEIRQLAAENMKRLCRDDDDAFFLNGSAVGVTSGGGGSQVAECDDEGIAAIVCTALMDLYSGRMAQVISLIRLARAEQDPKVRDAALHAALDFATNDEEALAEGRKWAPAADQKDGAS